MIMLPWLTALLLAPTVVQDVPAATKIVRQPLVGRVSRFDGTPWSGARVVLRSLPLSEVWCLEDIDVVETRTNERGRFRAKLLPGRNYFAWAWDWATRESDDGFRTYRITDVAGNVAARRPLVLSENPNLQVVYRIPVAGVEAWKPIGGVRAMLWDQVESDAPGASFRHAIELELSPDDSVQLPVWPTESASLVLFTRRGGSMGQKTVELSRNYAQQLAATTGEGDLGHALGKKFERTVPPPYPMLIKVVDAKGAKPVAGAELFLRWREHHFPFGRTDPDGMCRVYFPRKSEGTVNKRLQVGVGGYGMGVFFKSVDFSTARAPGAEIAQPDWVLPVERRELRGRILLPGGRPAAGAQLLMSLQYARDGGLQNDFANSVIHADANGRFVLHEVSAKAHYRVCVLLRPEHVAALDPEGREHLVPLVILADSEMPGAEDKQRDRDIGEIDLGKLCRTTLVVTSATGRVARNPTIVVSPDYAPSFGPLTIAGNARGTATFLHAKGLGFELAATWKHGFATGELKPSATLGERELRLEGRPATRIEGTVVDRDGHPVAGALVRLVFAGSGVADVETRQGKLLNRVDRTGSGGGYSLTLPVSGCTYRLTAKSWVGGRMAKAQNSFTAGNTKLDPLLRIDGKVSKGKAP